MAFRHLIKWHEPDTNCLMRVRDLMHCVVGCVWRDRSLIWSLMASRLHSWMLSLLWEWRTGETDVSSWTAHALCPGVSAADSWLPPQVLWEDRLRVHLPNDRSSVGWKSLGHPGVQTWACDPWPRQWRLLMETGILVQWSAVFGAARPIPSKLWRLSGTS